MTVIIHYEISYYIISSSLKTSIDITNYCKCREGYRKQCNPLAYYHKLPGELWHKRPLEEMFTVALQLISCLRTPPPRLSIHPTPPQNKQKGKEAQQLAPKSWGMPSGGEGFSEIEQDQGPGRSKGDNVGIMGRQCH